MEEHYPKEARLIVFVKLPDIIVDAHGFGHSAFELFGSYAQLM